MKLLKQNVNLLVHIGLTRLYHFPLRRSMH